MNRPGEHCMPAAVQPGPNPGEDGARQAQCQAVAVPRTACRPASGNSTQQPQPKPTPSYATPAMQRIDSETELSSNATMLHVQQGGLSSGATEAQRHTIDRSCTTKRRQKVVAQLEGCRRAKVHQRVQQVNGGTTDGWISANLDVAAVDEPRQDGFEIELRSP